MEERGSSAPSPIGNDLREAPQPRLLGGTVDQRALNNGKRVYSYFYHYLKETDSIFNIREKEKNRKEGEKPPPMVAAF